MNIKKWLLFAITVVAVIISQFYIQQRYTSLLQVGTEYQWPVKVSRSVGWVPSDYLEVQFLGSFAKWGGTVTPEVDQEVYVIVKPRSNGILEVVEATNQEPDGVEFIRAIVKNYDHGIVEFGIPFNRVKVDVNKVNPKFYQQYRGTLIGTLKIKDGYGVVTGIYSKGVPLEIANPESVVDQEKDSNVLLDKIGVTDQSNDDTQVSSN